MDRPSILPADSYIVINKTIINEVDRKLLTMLYQPIIGHMPLSLYFTLWADLDKLEIMSTELTHHHLMSSMKLPLEDIIEARTRLEAVGLLKTYVKRDNINNLIYEIYSPLSAYEFLNHPILSIVLFNNIGKKEYEKVVDYFKFPKIDLDEYSDITSSFSEIYEVIPSGSLESLISDIRKNNKQDLNIESKVDFNLLISSLPKNVSEKAFSKDIKELITKLVFVYNLDMLDLQNILRNSINEKGLIDKKVLRKSCRDFYKFETDGKLPSLVHKNQPEHLRNSDENLTKRNKMIKVFETMTPYNFLKSKYNGSEPTKREVNLLEELLVDIGLKAGVVNVLIDYVLKTMDNKLNKNYIDAIAGQWKRMNVETVSDAMDLCEKEHKRKVKGNVYKKDKELSSVTPSWFDKKVDKTELSSDEKLELDDMLKEFR